MSLSKYQLKQKQIRRAARLDKKERMNSAAFALPICTVIAIDAAKQVWKSDATNPKIEQFIELIFRNWEAISDNRVSFQTVCNSVEAETKIRYDADNGAFINLKQLHIKDKK